MPPSDVMISVRDVAKAYTIRHQLEHHITLAEQALAFVKNPRRRPDKERFWALEGIDLDVRQGEVLGVIGRNGAGKSTLLKILSRITPPTRGEIRLFGRVGSLLEVGTGFHPELTGRENIYLNGAILGMRKREIDRQFDAIVDFAGVVQFLDTPVKRYSSGMYVRLAFAVAAHLETEILLVDEVLSVGDADFQKRCLGKMGEVASHGRTVLFVSHNMHAVGTICTAGVLLGTGRIELIGTPYEVVNRYLTVAEALIDEDVSSAERALAEERRAGSGEVRVASARPSQRVFLPSESKRFTFSLSPRVDNPPGLWVAVLVKDERGLEIAHCDSRAVGMMLDDAGSAACEIEFSFEQPWMKPGRYWLDVFLCASGIIDHYAEACMFEVSPILPYAETVGEDAFARGAVLADFSFHRGPGSLASDR